MNKELDEAAETYAENFPFDVRPAFKAGAAWAITFLNEQMQARARKHGPPAVEWIKYDCDECGKTKEEQPATYRRRLKVSTTGKLFCSKACAIKRQRALAKLKAA